MFESEVHVDHVDVGVEQIGHGQGIVDGDARRIDRSHIRVVVRDVSDAHESRYPPTTTTIRLGSVTDVELLSA